MSEPTEQFFSKESRLEKLMKDFSEVWGVSKGSSGTGLGFLEAALVWKCPYVRNTLFLQCGVAMSSLFMGQTAFLEGKRPLSLMPFQFQKWAFWAFKPWSLRDWDL